MEHTHTQHVLQTNAQIKSNKRTKAKPEPEQALYNRSKKIGRRIETFQFDKEDVKIQPYDRLIQKKNFWILSHCWPSHLK